MTDPMTATNQAGARRGLITVAVMFATIMQALDTTIEEIDDCIRYGAEAPLDAGLDYESQLFGLLFASDDMRTGTMAFLQRQPAVFKGG